MYEVDLILVLSGWGASTITYITLQVRNQENLLLPTATLTVRQAHIRLELHSYAAGAETLYMYEVDML